MSDQVVVSNSSPIIALQQLGRLSLLEDLFGRIRIPPAVAAEVCSGLETWPDWLVTTAGGSRSGSKVLGTTLGPGESEAIDLALSLDADWVLLDDRPARRMADALGLRLLGTLGVLLAAKRRRLIEGVRAPIEQLVKLGFRVSPQLLASVYADADEQSAG